MTQQAAKKYHGELKATGLWQTKATALLAEEYGQSFGLNVSDSLTEWVEGPTPSSPSRRMWLVDWDGECYVTAYVTNLCYGGPEEGGWWYDWHQAIVSIPCLRRNALQMAEYLAKRYAPDHAIPKGAKYSDVNCGEMLEIYLEREPGENRSTERPHYE